VGAVISQAIKDIPEAVDEAEARVGEGAVEVE
jgi:hypothetical protein